MIKLIFRLSPRSSRSACGRCGAAALLVVGLLLQAMLVATPAHAEDLLSAALAREGEPSLERVFVEAQAALWLPGPETFYDNHRVGPQLGAELGVRVLSVREHNLFVVGAVTYSPQKLRSHLREEDTAMYLGYVGVRYLPGMLCAGEGVACPFLEAGVGLTWESAPHEAGHAGPEGSVTATGALGYRYRPVAHLTLGARIDVAYLEESYDSQIGWITPGIFVGVLL